MKLATAIKRLEADRKAYAEFLMLDGLVVMNRYDHRINSLSAWIEFRDNERIRKIESRAWGQVKRTNGLVRTEDFNEKFAELIVKEVTNIVLHYTDVDEGVAVAKKHFGVEE